MLNEQQSTQETSSLQDKNFENKIDIPMNIAKSADLNSIRRRCTFISSSLAEQNELTKLERHSVIAILMDTKDGKKMIEKLDENKSEKLKTTFEMIGQETPDLPSVITCAWIDKITGGKHCEKCCFRGVVVKPIDFGEIPWNAKKRTLRQEGHLNEEVLIAEVALGEYPGIYYQGENLVNVVGNRLKMDPANKHIPLEVRPLASTTLREILSKKFVFEQIDAKGEVRKVNYPPPNLVKGLIKRTSYPSLKYLRGITTVPVLRPDGTILQTPGYDDASELLYMPSHSYPLISENLSDEEVKTALDQLLDVVRDFPFGDNYGKAVYISTILTAVSRYAFHGCVPMVIVNANMPGVGKGKLVDIIGLIATGFKMPLTTQMDSDKEERKQITATLREGGRFLFYDNVSGPFGGKNLDALLTSDLWVSRILGGSNLGTFTNRLQVIATGNNIQLKSSDTIRRSLWLQLHTIDEHPEARPATTFRHPDLEGWVNEHHPQLLSAALTILRGYIAAGKPKQDLRPLGSFEGWTNLVQAAVKWAFGVDPGEAQILCHEGVDANKEVLEKLMNGWLKIVPKVEAATCRKVMDAVLDGAEGGRDILEALEMNSSKKPSAVELGYLLNKFRNTNYMGASFTTLKKVTDGMLWKLVLSS